MSTQKMAVPDKPQLKEDDRDLSLRSLRNNVKIPLVLAFLAGFITFIVLSQTQPHYYSEVRLTLSPVQTSMAPDSNDNKTRYLKRSVIEKQIDSLKSERLLLQIATNLNLAQREAGGTEKNLTGSVLPQDGTASDNQVTPAQKTVNNKQLLKSIRRRLNIFASRNSDIVIRFTSVDKYLAADFVNALAEAYKKRLSNVSLWNTQSDMDALQRDIDRLQREISTAERKLKRFRNETEAEPTSGYEQRLSVLNAQLRNAEDARAAARTKLEIAKSLLAKNLAAKNPAQGEIGNLPQVQNSAEIQSVLRQITSNARQLAEAQAILPPDHPQVRQIASDLEKLKAAAQNKISKILQDLETQFRVADDRVKNIRRDRDMLYSPVPQASANEAERRSLESTLQSKRGELERLQSQLEDKRTLSEANAVPVKAEIVSRGSADGEPDFLQMLPYILLASIAVFVLGITSLMAREIIVSSKAAVSDDALPGNSSASGESTTETSFSPLSQQADLSDLTGWDTIKDAAIDTVAHRIISHGKNITPCRTIIVGEHQMIEVARAGMMLARALAQTNQNVAVVDWHLTDESIAKRLRFNAENGILNLLKDNAISLKDIIAAIPGSNIRYIAVGDGLEAEEINCDSLKATLKDLDRDYDHIIFIGRPEFMQSVFETIQEYFHFGIVVTEHMEKSTNVEYGDRTFLNCDVTNIDIMRIGKR